MHTPVGCNLVFLFYYQTSPPAAGGMHTPVGCNLVFFFTLRPDRRQQEECTHLLVATCFSFLLSDQPTDDRRNTHTCWLQPDFLFYYQTSPPVARGLFFFTIRPTHRQQEECTMGCRQAAKIYGDK
jgi:hypothetical protein